MISVIVPCYNIEGSIGRCLHSILSQTYTELEVIIVDDGSTDGSGRICDAYAGKDHRVRVLHQKNAGLGPARNTGIEAARGDFLALVDGDDWIFPQMIGRMAAALEQADAQMAVCRYLPVSDTAVPERIIAGVGSGEGKVRRLSRDEALTALVAEDEGTVIQNAAWNKLYKRELFEGTEQAKPLRYPARRYEDIVITAKLLARCGCVAYIDDPLYAYVTDRQGSIMNASRLEGLLAEQIPAYWERDEFLESIGRHDLVSMHDYMVGKKLLELHTDGRRRGEGRSVRKLDRLIRDRYRAAFKEIYGCPIADKHHRLRMRLFLMHPMFYDAFTAVNESVVLPLKRRRGSGRRAGEPV